MNKEEIKIEKRKPTWNYILNDLALYSLMIKVIHSEDATYQEKFDFMHQIKLLQNQVEKLTGENNDLEEKYIRERDKSIKLTLKLSDLEEENEQVQNTNMQLATLNTNLRSTRDLYKSVIDKAINELDRYINFCENDSQGHYEICNIAIHKMKNVLEILRSKE